MKRYLVPLAIGGVVFVLGHANLAVPSQLEMREQIAAHQEQLLTMPEWWRLLASVLLQSSESYHRISVVWAALMFAGPWSVASLVIGSSASKKVSVAALVSADELALRFGDDLVLPEAGLYGGLEILGMTGVGKTKSAIEPAVRQVVSFKADNAGEKCSALFLEIKGDFGPMVTREAIRAGRKDDLKIIGEYHYNPLGNLKLKSSEMGDAIGGFMAEAKVSGGALEAHFWRHAGASMLGNAIETIRLNGDTATMSKVFRLIGSKDLVEKKLFEASQMINGRAVYVFDNDTVRRWATLKDYGVVRDEATGEWRADANIHLDRFCHPLEYPNPPRSKERQRDIKHRIERVGGLNNPALSRRLDTLKFDVEFIWRQIPAEQWPQIALASAETLKLFEWPGIEEVYCPPADDPKLLPPLDELMDSGKLVVVKYSVADEKLSRLISIMIKLDYYRAIQMRYENGAGGHYRRTVLFGDEWQKLAGHADVDFGAICRQAKCARILAYPGCEVLESFVGHEWKAVFDSCNSRLFLGANDMTTATEASKLCGHHKVWKPSPSLSRSRGSGFGSRGSESLSHTETEEPVFRPEEFINLPVGQAIALVWDGRARQPARRLKLQEVA